MANLQTKKTQVPFIKGAGDSRAIDPNDAIQGQLGDCGLIAALRAVAVANPGIIKNAIKDNNDGTYDVTLYVKNSSGNREPRIITVKSIFPLAKGAKLNGDILNGQQEIWPNLIEKAIIQLNGTFKNESPTEFLSMLTNRPSKYLSVSSLSNNKIGSILNATWKTGNPGVVWTPPKNKAPFNGNAFSTVQINGKSHKIYANHAYTLTAVNLSKMTVNLRNPWGSQDLIGLPISEFKKHFSSVAINRVHQQTIQASVVLEQEDKILPADQIQASPALQLLNSWQLETIESIDDEALSASLIAANFAQSLIKHVGTSQEEGFSLASMQQFTAIDDNQTLSLFESNTPEKDPLLLISLSYESNELNQWNEISPFNQELFDSATEFLQSPSPEQLTTNLGLSLELG